MTTRAKKKRGKVLIFSAPSGSGKTTIVHRVMPVIPHLEFSVSATTRPNRAHETHGKDYYFINEGEFKLGIDKGDFLEWEEVYPGRFYGTLFSEVERILSKGHSAVFDVDVKGGLNIKKFYGDQALAFFIQPPSLAVLRQRLLDRRTETLDDIERRLAKAGYELSFKDQFDKVIINDDLDRAVKETIGHIQDFLKKP